MGRPTLMFLALFLHFRRKPLACAIRPAASGARNAGWLLFMPMISL